MSNRTFRILGLLFIAAFYFAALPYVYAETTTATIQDHYKTVTKSVPYTETTCELIDVPIYGQSNQGASTTDLLFGALIGGAIGNNIPGEKNGGAAGAVVGTIIANEAGKNKQVVTGYRREEQCKDITRYQKVTDQVYSHSTITFTSGGRTRTIRFYE